jgi:hypothetical protein
MVGYSQHTWSSNMQFPRQSLIPFLLISISVSLVACSTEDDTPVACIPTAASNFPCANPVECLSVTATWCYPGAASCSNVDADLTLILPAGFTIDSNFDQMNSANGCFHDGDETGNVIDPDGDGITGPFNENITCLPHTQITGPNRIDAGTYVAGIRELSLLDTGSVLLDINVNGQTSCQIMNIDAGPVQVNVIYP